jgi:hypothetical protein
MTNEVILDLTSLLYLICNFLTVLSKITTPFFFAFELVFLMRKAGISSPVSEKMIV